MNPYEMVSPVPSKASDLANDSSLAGTTVKDALDGVTTSLSAKQPLDATLTALAAANWAANSLPIGTGADTLSQTAFAANTFPARSSAGNLVATAITDFGLSLVDDVDASAARTTLGLGTVATLPIDTDGTLAANSDTRVATQKAVKTYVDTTVTGVLKFKGSTDCSANPNYPAALKGDSYIVSVAGKIGGASGKSVDIGDVFAASADNAGGTEASVGASWFVLEHNLVGALLSANNLSDLANAATAVNNLGGATSTGTGGLTRLNGPTLVAPILGVASATSINKMAVTAPATGSTLAIADGKTLTASNTLTLAGTDGSTLNVGAGGTLGALALKASVDLSTGDATGVLAAGRFPALTGDVTTAAGALAATITNNAVTYGKLQQVAANSLIGNPGGSLANAAAVGLTANLKMTAGSLDTVQAIQTSSTPQFARQGIGVAASANAAALLCIGGNPVAFTSANYAAIVDATNGGALVVAKDATNYGILQYSAASTAFGFTTVDSGTAFSSTIGCKGGNVIVGGLTPPASATRNMVLSGGATSPIPGVPTPDMVSVCGYDRVNTRHAAAGNRVFALQTERGSLLCIGDDAIDFLATQGIVSVNGSDVLGINSASLTIGHTGTALGTLEARATSGSQLVASYDASNSLGITVSSAGLATLTGAGASKGLVLTDGVQAGSGAGRAKVGGTIKTITGSNPNGTTVETDLQSATIAANTLANDGDSLEVQMNFQIPNNANNKTIKFYVDGVQILTSGAAAVAGQFAQIVATITRVNSTTTIIACQFIPETGSAWSRVDKQPSQNIDWTASRVIKATGQSSAASNDVIQRSTTIKYNPANP